ncbi:MAG: protein-L-isoaspartate(D-aspartate) O-methyltransferase [Pseudomonadota bacterium]
MRSIHALLVAMTLFVLSASAPAQETQTQPDTDKTSFDAERHRMVLRLANEIQLAAPLTGIETISQKVLDAMEAVPRHAFVPELLKPFAYSPNPLPVHPEQNLAAPFLIALMTELAAIEPADRIFETGTGAGYHAAVMASLGAEIFSVELIPELVDTARSAMDDLAIDNVQVRQGDGYFGWQEEAPFDVIVIKEAVNHIPPPLLTQLAPDGRLIAPIGSLDGPQFLTLVTRRPDGSLRERRYLSVRFSPLQGGERI